MEEHAMFIDGLLDPTEKNLKQAANLVAKSFEKLLNQSINLTQNLLIKESIESTNKIISYKEAATSGLLKCQIKSIIPPLLADHVLREANYYLRILNNFCK
ncbi:MAG: DUF2935 domain-containing protein [Bacilli bacterium]|nr:DUF2935 domain-containing protein [Bacilli bacterium]